MIRRSWIRRSRGRTLGFVILLAGAGILFSGCANLGTHEDSDMPWNTPQNWEGVTPIPGMTDPGY